MSERLERIKQRNAGARQAHGGVYITAADLDWLIEQAESSQRRQGLLKRLEWAGSLSEKPHCPACRQHQEYGHQMWPRCWLSIEL